ncbi:Hypothetical protein PHPALM_14248 [Phytophthora palmivora]|uniref:Uncharacterized protein n=1 Tax=Phytophthora palmivora TaxID=4796 RepID=A0A2P4XVH0_9STRA|nr:Hypothetical protein PHPALM_14248 [Phytophthora palmivora]
MSVTKSTAPCGGWGRPTGPVHRCPKCFRRMQPFCGRPTGNGGFDQPVICTKCGHDDHASRISLWKASASLGTTGDVIEVLDSDSVVATAHPQSLPSRQTSRHTQILSSISHRLKVVRWMKDFISDTRAAILSKVPDWWMKREHILDAKCGTVSLSARRCGWRWRVCIKAAKGRGRSKRAWVERLYPILLDEFDRLRKLGVKIEPALLLQLGKPIIP